MSVFWVAEKALLQYPFTTTGNGSLPILIHPLGWESTPATSLRYIPSEKIGQFFWPPRNGFFGINYHQWTWGNAFWPFLAPPDPWGVSGGVGGGQGGSVGPKFSNFFGATFGFQNAKFWIVWTENTPFSSFLAKFSPPGDQKCPFWAEMVEHKSAFFSKTSSLNCLKMHQNKVLGSILI